MDRIGEDRIGWGRGGEERIAVHVILQMLLLETIISLLSSLRKHIQQ